MIEIESRNNTPRNMLAGDGGSDALIGAIGNDSTNAAATPVASLIGNAGDDRQCSWLSEKPESQHLNVPHQSPAANSTVFTIRRAA
jgi:hypothetical protein